MSAARSRRKFSILLLGMAWVLPAVITPGPARAVPQPPASLASASASPARAEADESAKKLAELRARMEQEKKALSATLKKQGGILDKLDALQTQIRRAQDRLADLDRQRKTLVAESRSLIDRSQELREKVDARRELMGKRLRARYRFGRTGFFRLWFGSESFADFSRRRKYLTALFAVDLKRLEEYRDLLALWQEAQARVAAKQASLSSLETVALEQKAEMESERGSLTQMLTAVREEKATHEAVLAELRQNESRLTGLISSLDRKAAREQAAAEAKAAAPPPREGSAPAENAGPASPESGNPAVAPPPAAPPEASPSPAPPPESPPAAGEEAPLSPPGEAEARPENDFEGLRGRLCSPAHGPVISEFGRKVHPQFNTVIPQNGIEIGAAAGSPVRAVAPGTVRFAQWFQGYGNLVIVEHGGGYYTIYAHLADFRVGPGARVNKGAVLGTVGDTGSLSGPLLYFEIRRHETPLNPAGWLGGC